MAKNANKTRKKQIAVFFTEEDTWLLEAMELKQIDLEKQGISVSKNQLILMALEHVLKKYRGERPPKKSTPHVVPKNEVKVTVPKRYRWFIEVLQKIVKLKHEYGIERTSVSREFLRLAINGYKNEMRGAEIDRALLDDDPE